MRKPLNTQQKKWADNLKRIWDTRKKELNLTQEKAGYELGWTQGAVGHYIKGRTPLNTDAKIKFSELLNVPVTDIDPDFSSTIINNTNTKKNAVNENTGSYSKKAQLSEAQILLLREIIHNIERKQFKLTADQKARLITGVFVSFINNGLTASDLSDSIIDAARISAI